MTNACQQPGSVFKSHSLLLAFTSGILLVLCFPRFSLGFVAWFALVPLLLAVYDSPARAHALFRGGITGILFFGFSLHWLTYVTTFGWFFMTFFESSFLMLFSWMIYEGRGLKNPYLQSIWVGFA
ncbi:MAG: hypothetical protein NC930_00970, partial [Candidatus Omnitrophica bacterium]|nr:hypothetical protein [Candidatus Omnitrophota bacterium]